jgi:hypothetical protein
MAVTPGPLEGGRPARGCPTVVGVVVDEEHPVDGVAHRLPDLVQNLFDAPDVHDRVHTDA